MPPSKAIAPGATSKLRTAAIAGIVARNVMPVIGMTFLDWRAAHLVVLYFADTMLGIAAIFTLLFMYAKDMPYDRLKPKDLVGVVLAICLLTGIFALVFGMPLLFVSATDTIDWGDDDLRLGLLVQLLFGLVTFLTMSAEMRRAADPETLLRARWGYVTMRWVAVFAMCAFVPWAPLLILAYVGASIWLEIRPLPPEAPF